MEEIIQSSREEQGQSEGTAASMPKRMIGASTLHICINEENEADEIYAGTISGTALEETHEFASMQEMALLIDRLLDKIGRPQKSLADRDFKSDERKSTEYVGSPKLYHESEEILAVAGELATFDVIFQTRKHGTWQGLVLDTDGRRIDDFASEIQLFELMRENM